MVVTLLLSIAGYKIKHCGFVGSIYGRWKANSWEQPHHSATGKTRRTKTTILEDVHEAVVTKEVWQTVQDIIDRHTKVKPCTSGYENIFGGLLKCPDCGQTLLIHTDNRNPDRDLLDKLKKRNIELDQMYIRLYEDYSSGKLSEKKFTMMSAHYEQEQDANEEKLSELERRIKKSLLLLPMRSSLQRALHSAQA